MNEITLEKPKATPLKLYRMECTADAGEYFRIWIVNLFLSILTLGIYSAWAKVRTRQYLYSTIKLDGHPFEYLGDPMAIFKGNLIIGLGVVAYVVTQDSGWLLLVVLLFALVYPYLVYKSLRFMASNSAYRNVRFRFWGTLEGAYKYHLFWPILSPLTFGLLFPLVFFKQRKYLVENTSYGEARASFTGEAGKFFSMYWVSYGIGIAAMLLTGMLMVALAFGMNTSFSYLMIGVLYAFLILGGVALQQYFYAQTLNYTFDQTTLSTGLNTGQNNSQIRFRVKLNPITLIKIQLVNVLAIGVSLGLLSPWARVRYLKYVTSRIGVLALEGTFDHIAATDSQEKSALGDAAADFMDFDVAL